MSARWTMPRVRCLTVAMLVGIGATASAAPAHSNQSDEAISAQVAAGKSLFTSSCSNCHGSGGKGAMAPALVDRGLPSELIRTTILNGRVGTPMPPFKDDLDAASQAQIIAYVESINSGGRMPTAVIVIDSTGSAAAADASKPTPVGNGSGFAAHGAALFFDPTQVRACRTCHSVGNKGGPVGPDMSTSRRTPLEILNSLSHAKLAAPTYPAVDVELLDGSHVIGIRSEESSEMLRLFDVTSLPPVRRSIQKSTIRRATPIVDAGIYDHTRLNYSKQDLLDLSAYLGVSN